MADPVWIIDTSSVIEVRRLEKSLAKRTFSGLANLAAAGRLKFPRQVLDELRRAARPDTPDAPLEWAESVEKVACASGPALGKVKEVLAEVPDVLDKDKDSGVDEADPYVLALAASLRQQDVDARIVTQETKDSPNRMSLNTAAGILGVPSVPLGGLLRAEKMI